MTTTTPPLTYLEAKLLALRELPQHICLCRKCGHKVLLSSGSRLLTDLCWSCGLQQVSPYDPRYPGAAQQWLEMRQWKVSMGIV